MKKGQGIGKVGRRNKFIITPEMLKEIGLMYSRGMTQADIYGYYSIGADTWYNYLKAHNEVVEVLQQSRPQAKNKLLSVLEHMANCLEGKDNYKAVTWMLKNVHKMNEETVITVKPHEDIKLDDAELLTQLQKDDEEE
jgi:methylthioribose-1-phosphate isomerase